MTPLKTDNRQVLMFVGLLFVLVACQGQNEAGRKTQLALESQLSAAEQVELIARIGDRKITLRDLERRLNEQPPFLRTLYGNSQRKIGLLIEWVRLHLLANEAIMLGLENSRIVKEQTNAALVGALLDDLSKRTVREHSGVLSTLAEEHLDEGQLDALRARQQRDVLKSKEDAILKLLSEHDAQRRVTYRQDTWSKFKANDERPKD
jgi:hypothetical protein